MNSHALLSIGVAAVATLVAIPVLARCAGMIGLVDKPDARKQHHGVIPLVGGLGVAVGVLAFAVSGLGASSMGVGFWFGVTSILVMGALDDRFGLPPKARFVLQAMVAAIALWLGGVQLDSLGDLFGMGEIRLGAFALPFTVFAIVGMINAFNLSDGLDGLAGGLAMISCMALAAVGLMGAGYFAGPSQPLLCALIGALLGFLAYNMRTPWRAKAAVFMGDAGSTTLGFILGWFAVAGTGTQVDAGVHGGPSPMTMVWVMAMPLLDTVVTMARRIRWRSSPFNADREHVHHLLMRAGLPVEQAVFVIHMMAVALAGFGMLLWVADVSESAQLLWFCTVFLGYFSLIKFLAYRARVREGTIVRKIQSPDLQLTR